MSGTHFTEVKCLKLITLLQLVRGLESSRALPPCPLHDFTEWCISTGVTLTISKRKFQMKVAVFNEIDVLSFNKFYMLSRFLYNLIK